MKQVTAKGYGDLEKTGNTDIHIKAASMAHSGGYTHTKTFSSLANIPRHKRQKLVNEARPMLGGARKCKEIWYAIRKADFRNEGILNEANIKLVFEKCKAQIFDLLRLQTPVEFIEVFDCGMDGALNQDEQILIFSIVKEKMQLFATECQKIHEYQLYKDLMREVRLLEAEIVNYQDEMRTSIQQKQMKEYVDIGNDQLQDFYVSWQSKFEVQEEQALEKIQELQLDHEEQMEKLNQKLDRAVEAAKIKPQAKLKEMQNNEKLVAVNERIEEAMNYRKELKDLEVKEAERVESLRQLNADKQRSALQTIQKKEILQVEAKIETGRHNLKIQMDKELNVLQKQINLHVHDIERIQGFVSRLAITKGKTVDELRRNKAKAKKTMEQLKRARQTEKEQNNQSQTVDSRTQKVVTAGQGSGATMGTLNSAFVEGSIIDTLLFGMKNRGSNLMATSFGQTASSEGTNSSHAHVVPSLRHLIKNSPITNFKIATVGTDGERMYSKDNAGGSISSLPQDDQLQTKIQVLLDQRKPPTEELPSLCQLYDDDLNPIEH